MDRAARERQFCGAARERRRRERAGRLGRAGVRTASDADIAWAMMSINAVKGVEIGAGFESIVQKGSEHGDEMTPQGFVSNNNGGVLGGHLDRQAVTGIDRPQAHFEHPGCRAGPSIPAARP